MKLQKPVVEESQEATVSEKAKSLAQEVADLEKQKELEESLKPTAEKIIEQILLGTRTPTPGMELNIEINGIFTLFNAKSTKSSYFRYTYPPKSNGEAPQETPEPTEEQQETKEPEEYVPII